MDFLFKSIIPPYPNFIEAYISSPSPLPKPSLGSSCQSLSPPGGAPGLAVHWIQLLCLLPLLAIWPAAAAGLLLPPGSDWTAQAVLPTSWPPSAAAESYWQPGTVRQEVKKDECAFLANI